MSQLTGGVGIDRDMQDLLHGRRKSRGQVVIRLMRGEPLPFPCEIMVMCDRAQILFGDQFGQRQAERDVHGNGESILDDDHVNLKTRRRIQPGFAGVRRVTPALPASLRPSSAAARRSASSTRKPAGGENALFDHHAAVFSLIALAGKEKALVPHFAEDVGPFERFQRDSIGACQPRRNESDSLPFLAQDWGPVARAGMASLMLRRLTIVIWLPESL